MREAGVEPEDVDYVFNRHLHVDHVGWNTSLLSGKWVPTFPNARYLFSAKEFAFYGNPQNVHQPSEGVFEDSVLPIVAAGLDEQLSPDAAFPVEGFMLHSTPGHSHDHLSLSFTSQGESALFMGDAMHHPLQVAIPAWNSVFCEPPKQAYHSRLAAIKLATERDAVVFTTHFPGTSVGKILQDLDHNTRWLPL